MKLSDLTAAEDVVLLGWTREIVESDGHASAPEEAHVQALRDALGAPRYERAAEAARARFPTRASLRDAAKLVSRPEARRAIYSFLHTLAASDSVSADEERPLRWLAAWWQLDA